MTLTRKQHIARIADKCEARQNNPVISVRYGSLFSDYAVVNGKPSWLGGNSEDASQYVIDGMRLAAQRVIDRRRIKPTLSETEKLKMQQRSFNNAYLKLKQYDDEFSKAAAKIGNANGQWDIKLPRSPGVEWRDLKSDGHAFTKPEPPVTLDAIRQIIREELARK